MNTPNQCHPLKPPTTFKEQVQRLHERNMIVGEEETAEIILERLNYYRLSGYMLSFKEEDHLYKSGSTFENVVRLYEFDRKLRNLLIGILESIEIAGRTHVAYHLAHKYGELSYESSSCFVNQNWHEKFLSDLSKATADARRGHELFVEHHDLKYGGKLPFWAAVELMSFGMISKLFSNLQPEIRKQVAGLYY